MPSSSSLSSSAHGPHSSFAPSSHAAEPNFENWPWSCALLEHDFAPFSLWILSRPAGLLQVAATALGWGAGSPPGFQAQGQLIPEGDSHEGGTATQKGVLRCTTTPPICATGLCRRLSAPPPSSLTTTILEELSNEEVDAEVVDELST